MSQRQRVTWYRWEGVYTADFTLEGVRRRCRRLADTLAARKWSCLVAHDTRFLSAQFARYAFLLLETHGVRTSFCTHPTSIPMVELALEQKRADCALLVSAGNRPHWYNGLIVLAPPTDGPLLEDGGPLPPETEPPPSFPPAPADQHDPNQADLRGAYFDLLRSLIDLDLIRRSTLTVFVDPMNGSTSGSVPALLGEGAQIKAIEINRELDPLFARQPPQPSESGLNRLRKLVRESDSHLGVAMSADGRALGLADNTGDLVTPLETALLLAQYQARQYRHKGTVVAPQQPSDLPGLRAWEQATGVKVELVADPAGRIAELLSTDRHNLLAGVTAAGELTLGRYGQVHDATLAAMLLIELAARSSGKLRPLIEELRARLLSP